jgi:hypothetical protein
MGQSGKYLSSMCEVMGSIPRKWWSRLWYIHTVEYLLNNKKEQTT